MRKRFLIVIGAPLTNMGSQAIVRGLVKNIRLIFPSSYVEVITTERCDSLTIPGVDRLSYRYSLVGLKHLFLRCLNKVYCIFTGRVNNRLIMYDFRKKAKTSNMTFIVGADNYDISYNSLGYMNETNRFLYEIGVDKTIMFNCSFDSCDFTSDVIADLSRFQIITTRDSISYKNVKKALPHNNVLFIPDIAFSMDYEKIELPKGWINNQMVGVNLSSLITESKYGSSKDRVIKAYKALVDYIIKNTHYNICFIPHVKNNADLKVLQILYDYVSKSNRAIIIHHENYNAAQKKYIISQCRLFIGARTHSTIAAYSTCVPTLVIGYSVKSKGIATDLFGTADGYVVPVQSLNNIKSFLGVVNQFFSNEERIRLELQKAIPPYIKKTESIQDLIKSIIEKEPM